MQSSDKIKICFISPKAYVLFNPNAKNVKDPFGGSEVDLYLLALELAKDRSFEVSFVTADYGQKEVETIQNVKVIKSLDFNENYLSGTIKVWRAMRTADAQIYFHEAVSWGTFLVAVFCRLNDKMFVYRTAHQRECNGTYLKQHYFAGKAFLWSLRSAVQVIVQNETDKRQIEQTVAVSSTIIPNGHCLPELTKDERDIILWVGRSTPVKRPELFIDLAEQINNEKFVMICPRALGDEKYEQLTSLARTVRNLEFIENVPFHQINEFFQRAKVFVCTSQAEGFPNTYIEACKHATPILSLYVNPDDFLNKYKCGMCADNNWDSFTKLLNILLQPEKLKELGKNARKYAEEKHDIKKIAEKYKELFLRLK